MDTGQGVAGDQGFGSRLIHFSGELGRRRVWRTALAYGAVVFVLLQLGEIVFPAFGAPSWALRLLVVSCFLGFPIVLCMAWVFDITPRGIKRTLGVTYSSGGLLHSGKALPRLALFGVIFFTMGGLGWWTVQDAIHAAPAATVQANGPALLASSGIDEMAPVQALAVLPLDDFSEEEGGAFFTAGLHEEIVSQLSQIDAIRVVSRTSVVQYDRSGKTMPIIAQDLGVDAVVEGSVFRAGDRVRITVQLIHGPSDTHLWANSYEGTVDDVIALQREVAQAIAGEIQSEILGPSAETVPTRTLAERPPVPEDFQKGRGEVAKGTPESLASAIQLYERVLDEDSSFSPAKDGLESARRRLDLHRSDRVEGSPEDRIAGARRLAAASHYQEAEGILRTVITEMDPESSAEAWKVMEQLKAVRGDIEGVVQLRMEKLAVAPGGLIDSVSLSDLRALIQTDGEEGFWAWKVEELEGLEKAGQEVSPVELARACVGIGDLEAAFPYLEQALEEGDKNLISLWTDPAWETLWEDPRFQGLLTELRKKAPGRRFPHPLRP